MREVEEAVRLECDMAASFSKRQEKECAQVVNTLKSAPEEVEAAVLQRLADRYLPGELFKFTLSEEKYTEQGHQVPRFAYKKKPGLLMALVRWDLENLRPVGLLVLIILFGKYTILSLLQQIGKFSSHS